MLTLLAFSLSLLSPADARDATARCPPMPAVAVLAGAGASAAVAAGGAALLLGTSNALPMNLASVVSIASLPLALGVLVAVPAIVGVSCGDVAPAHRSFSALIGYLAGVAAGLIVGVGTGAMAGAASTGFRASESPLSPDWLSTAALGGTVGAFVVAPMGAGLMTWWDDPADPS